MALCLVFDNHLSYTFVSLSQENHLCSIALDEISQVFMTNEAAKPHPMQELHIFIFPPLPPLVDEHEHTVQSIIVITITAIVMVTTIGICICIWKNRKSKEIQVIFDMSVLSIIPCLNWL